MDAVDVNWCLSCGCRIDVEGPSPYCSQTCMNSDVPSAAVWPSQLTLSSLERDSILDDDDDDILQDVLPPPPTPSSPPRNSWVGRGEAGIRQWASSIPRGAPNDHDDVPTATLRPKLLLQSSSPVKPSLAMSRAQPAPAEPSRPILTPQQSLPSLSRDSTSALSASVLSLATGSSSSSVVTPATGSEVGSLYDSSRLRSFAGPGSFLGGFRAQLKALVAPPSPKKDAQRPTTLTRVHEVHVVDGSDTDSIVDYPTFKVRRTASPVSLYYTPEMAARKGLSSKSKENQPLSSRRPATGDHPAYRARGRKALRVPS
ncbi:uncharacterized protein BXZ73DRAFT_45275 [Epithele typhae]|uniref:uncharacterized protein n=1 Tax=Epithele typhae TaxID=378194 RepID=UPI00200773F2|nr:uncharacterized protein BXZ73DRAFT_45275 [Epithele typhae]KAH9935873.1 hypothetical protein BXZ73DRAFT_45275 [Epithele typhae]